MRLANILGFCLTISSTYIYTSFVAYHLSKVYNYRSKFSSFKIFKTFTYSLLQLQALRNLLLGGFVIFHRWPAVFLLNLCLNLCVFAYSFVVLFILKSSCLILKVPEYTIIFLIISCIVSFSTPFVIIVRCLSLSLYIFFHLELKKFGRWTLLSKEERLGSTSPVL